MKCETILRQTNATLTKRREAAEKISASKDLLQETTDIIVDHNEEFSLKALMVLEVIGRHSFEHLKPYITELVFSGDQYLDSSSRRCLAKIFHFAITEDLNIVSNFNLNTQNKNKIIEVSFLWLTTKEKTAVKVFSMQNIFDLRNEEKWISGELQAIMEKDIASSSAGYKSRAVKILRKLKQ